MSFTNQAMSILGGAAAVSTMSQNVSNQKNANELKKAELGVELKEQQEAVYKAGQDLNKNTGEITHQMVLEGNDDGLIPKNGETPEQAEARAVDEYLNAKSEAAEDRYQDLMSKIKHPEKSKRIAMAMKAADEAQDAINARRQLKYDLEMAKKKVTITRQALEGVK